MEHVSGRVNLEIHREKRGCDEKDDGGDDGGDEWLHRNASDARCGVDLRSRAEDLHGRGCRMRARSDEWR